jgi:nucleotide-binding universal stress UspA family protein
MGGRIMKILHPTDFSECASEAQAVAADLARKLAAELVLVQVMVEAPLYSEGFISRRQVQTVYDAQRKWAEETLEARAEQLRQSGIKTSWRVQAGAPHEEIVRTAEEEHAEMIVMGTHGRSGLNRMVLGSVAERVIRLARCPVLTVRQSKSGGAQ